MNPLLLAWKNMLRNRRRSYVTLLITAMGTAAVLIAGGFALYTYAMLADGAASETGHIIVGQQGYFEHDEETPLQYGITDAHTLEVQLKKDSRVRHVLPRIDLTGLISNGDKSLIFVGTGMEIQTEADVRGPFLKLLEGHLTAPSSGVPGIVLGSDLARSLAAHAGSGLTLLATTTAGALNAVDVQVSGIVTTGWRDLDQRLVYMDIGTAQRLLATHEVGSLHVYLKHTDDTAAVLAKFSGEDRTHEFRPWWKRAFYYASVRALYNRIFGLLGIIIAALVFFSVTNTMAMAVVERTREIGTLRALGALPSDITRQFMREGVLIGFLGSLVGTLIAGAVILALPHLGLVMPPPPGRSTGYPLLVTFSPLLALAAGGVIVALCGLAAFLASRKAATHPIVEALAHV